MTNLAKSLAAAAFLHYGTCLAHIPRGQKARAQFPLQTNSVRDVGLEEITPHSFVQFGMPYEFRATLRSFGVQPIANVSVDVWLYYQTSGLNDVESVTVGGVACTRVRGRLMRHPAR